MHEFWQDSDGVWQPGRAPDGNVPLTVRQWRATATMGDGRKVPVEDTSVGAEREKAQTYDDGKAPLAHLPWAAMRAISAVQGYGHRKYGDFYNYRKGMEVSRNVSCALRHIAEYMEGSDKDHESGEHPLAHAITRLSFVLQNIHDGTALDDRFSRRTSSTSPGDSSSS